MLFTPDQLASVRVFPLAGRLPSPGRHRQKVYVYAADSTTTRSASVLARVHAVDRTRFPGSHQHSRMLLTLVTRPGTQALRASLPLTLVPQTGTLARRFAQLIASRAWNLCSPWLPGVSTVLAFLHSATWFICHLLALAVSSHAHAAGSNRNKYLCQPP